MKLTASDGDRTQKKEKKSKERRQGETEREPKKFASEHGPKMYNKKYRKWEKVSKLKTYVINFTW